MISVVIQGESGLRLVGGGRLRLGLRGGDGLLDGDGVDLRHERRQRGVDHPVALQQPLPLELVRHHLDLVARAAPSHQSINQDYQSNEQAYRGEGVGVAYPPDVSVTT